MSCNIGFSRTKYLKFHNKSGFFTLLHKKKPKIILTNCYGITKIPNLQNLEISQQISHFEWTLHNGRRKKYLEYGLDNKKKYLMNIVEMEIIGKIVKHNNYKEKKMID